MGRKSGPDERKLKKIKDVLKENPNGLWVREIARKTGLDKSTVSLYLEKHMANEIEEIFVSESKWVKIVRLKK
jgi:DNA invertase Pin-like site-specific DNA recombinase